LFITLPEKNKLFKFEGPYKSGRYVVVLGPSTFVCMRNLTKVEDMLLLFWDLPIMSGEVLSNTKANFEKFSVIELQTFMISSW
jgi:hypothetical protein